MGGYAFFVWTSYALTLLVVVANIVWPLIQRKQIIARVKRALKREMAGRETTAANSIEEFQ